MRDMEVFIKLIHGEEIDYIMKAIKLPKVKGGSEQLKKINLLKKLKSPGKTNPFYNLVNQHIYPEYKELTEKQLFFFMNDSSRSIYIPDTIKFSNLYHYFGDKLRELLPTIEENIEKGRPPFELGYKLGSFEEVIKYCKQTAVINKPTYMSDFVKIMKEYFTDDEKVKIEEYIEKIKDLDLVSYYNQSYELDVDIPNEILEVAFIATHLDTDVDMKAHMINNVLYPLLSRYKTQYDSLMNKIDGNVLDEAMISMQNEVKEKEEEISNLKKNIKDLKQENRNIKQGATTDKEHLNEALKVIKNELKEEKKTNKNIIEEHKVEIQNINQKNSQLEKSLKEQKYIMECACEETNNEENEDSQKIALLYTKEFNLAQMLFPEVVFISSAKWKQRIRYYKDLKMIIIQRDGLSSTEIRPIEKYSRDNNIKTITIVTNCDKRVIEIISCVKKEMRDQ